MPEDAPNHPPLIALAHNLGMGAWVAVAWRPRISAVRLRLARGLPGFLLPPPLDIGQARACWQAARSLPAWDLLNLPCGAVESPPPRPALSGVAAAPSRGRAYTDCLPSRSPRRSPLPSSSRGSTRLVFPAGAGSCRFWRSHTLRRGGAAPGARATPSPRGASRRPPTTMSCCATTAAARVRGLSPRPSMAARCALRIRVFPCRCSTANALGRVFRGPLAPHAVFALAAAPAAIRLT